MKKRNLIFLVLFILLLMLTGCALFQKEDTTVDAEAEAKKPTYKLYLSVNLASNSSYPYDIAVFIDDKEVGTVADGKSLSAIVDVKEGTHELRINKLGKKSIKVTKTIEIKGDTSFSCDVKHKKASMEMYNLSTKEGTGDSALVFESVEGLLYGRAVQKLERIGFTNIKGSPSIETGKENEYVVVGQNVEDGDAFDKNEQINLECMMINDYLDMYYKGLTIMEAQELASKNEFSIKYTDNSGADLDEKVIFMGEDEKQIWKVIGAEQVSNTIISVRISQGSSEPDDSADEKEDKAEADK
ncbi:MAG: hypothetical protein IKP88_00785 [Lachnospiraceae bacterium]|nr:hypothetical protein [Lachnospiraceae bacterium]